MARWDDGTVRTVRERTDVVAVVGETVRLRRQGRQLVGLCPFHQERSPSFGVSPDKGLYYCFGCGAGGDVFDFVMRRDGLSFPEALEHLAERAGVEIAHDDADPVRQAQRRERDRLYAALAEAERWYAQRLRGPEGQPARAYLAGRRVDAATADAFGIGYAPGGAGPAAHLRELGYAPDEMERAGLGPGSGGRDRLGGRVVLPIKDGQGRTVGFGGRALGATEPKYLNSPDGPLFQKRYLLYGLDRARAALRRGGEALVVEGYFDVIACHRAGFDNTVATLGTAFGREAAGVLGREARAIVFAYDADAAGIRAAKAALALCDTLGLTARAARIAGGKDPAEILAGAGGRERLATALSGALPRVPFLLDSALAAGAGPDPERKAEIAREVLSAVRDHPSDVARAAYMRDVAKRLDVPEDSLWRELERLGPRQPAPPQPHRREKNGNDNAPKRAVARAGREEELTAIVLNAPGVGRAIGVDPGRFQDPELARLVAAALDGRGDMPDDLRPRAAALLVGRPDQAEKYPDAEVLEVAARDLWHRLEADFARAQRAAWRERIAEMERDGQTAPAPYLEAVRREVKDHE